MAGLWTDVNHKMVRDSCVNETNRSDFICDMLYVICQLSPPVGPGKIRSPMSQVTCLEHSDWLRANWKSGLIISITYVMLKRF